MEKLGLVALAILMVGCTKIIEVEKIKEVKMGTYTGTYPTEDVRVMWQSCFAGHQQARRVPPQVAAIICDCVADQTRVDFKRDDIQAIYGLNPQGNSDNKSNADMVKYWTKANYDCEMKTKIKLQKLLPQQSSLTLEKSI